MVSLITDSVADAGKTEQLRVAIEQRLNSSAITQLRSVVCESNGQLIVLKGQVDSFYLKQLAQETVKQLNPQALILNLVNVK